MAYAALEPPFPAIYPLPPLVVDALGIYNLQPNVSSEEVAEELSAHHELAPEKLQVIAQGALHAWRNVYYSGEPKRLNRALFYVAAKIEPDEDILEEVTKIDMPGLPSAEGHTSTQMLGVNVRYTEAAARQTREMAFESTSAIFALAQYITDASAH